MACVVELLRVPQYKKISFQQIQLINSFLQWEHECEKGSPYASSSFEKWCGHSMTELHSKKAVEFYRPFFYRKKVVNDDEYQCYGIVEQVARIPKASQILNWIMTYVLHTNDIPYEGIYKITREQLEQLLEACNNVRRYGISLIRLPKSDVPDLVPIYDVNEAIARTFLPIRELDGNLMFPYKYGCLYADQVIHAIRVLNEILATTNFEEETIYFQYR